MEAEAHIDTSPTANARLWAAKMPYRASLRGRPSIHATYRVTFESGVSIEVTPARHRGHARFIAGLYMREANRDEGAIVDCERCTE